jgi:hypothetical protein
MTDLRDDWDLFTLRLSTAPSVCVLSDFDGTLVPLDHSRCRLLASLAATNRTVVGILSKRSPADLTSRLPVKGLRLVDDAHKIRRDLPAGTLVVYFGNDRGLHGIDIRVEVGVSTPSPAHYTLPDPDAVWEVLRRMLDALAD